MRRLIFLTLMIVNSLAIIAQNVDRQALIRHINEIKNQNDTYSRDQYTHPNADTARIGSLKRLIIHIESALNNNVEFTTNDIESYAKLIPINRGNLHQYFAYIKKSVALSIKPDMTVSTTGGTLGLDTSTGNGTSVPPTQDKPFVPDAFTQRIYEVRTFSNVYKLLKSMQGNGQILQFGKLRDVEDYSSFDLILFDMKSQDIVTLLSGETGNGTRTNLLDGKADSLKNYPKELTAVIWYIKK